jgi:hypothetical protein
VGLGRPGYALTAVDASGGRHNGLAIGTDGFALISYDGGRSLKVAHCSNLACTSATTSTLETCMSGNCELFTSVAIGADGRGLIPYADSSVGPLKVAHCSDVPCSSATISTLGEPDNFAFQVTSVAIGADGLGLIAFIEPKGLVPKVAHCSNVACSEATITSIDPNAAVFREGVSVTIGSDGLGLISYQSSNSLKVAHCSDLVCSSATATAIDSGNVGGFSSITTGSDGLGLISYHDNEHGNLKVAHCLNVICSSATTDTIDSGNVGGSTSLTIGSDGLGLISYEPPTTIGLLKVAHCSNTTCSSATTTTLDTGNLFGIALTTGVDGLPLISYFRVNAPGGLRVVHCSNVFCIPYFRRR